MNNERRLFEFTMLIRLKVTSFEVVRSMTVNVLPRFILICVRSRRGVAHWLTGMQLKQIANLCCGVCSVCAAEMNSCHRIVSPDTHADIKLRMQAVKTTPPLPSSVVFWYVTRGLERPILWAICFRTKSSRSAVGGEFDPDACGRIVARSWTLPCGQRV
jgi:hypothetical protein